MPTTTTSTALTRMVEQAGGTVTGTVSLTEEFVDANSAEKLLSVVNSPIVPAGAQLSTGSVDQGSQAGDLLGIALLINKDPKAPPVDDAAAGHRAGRAARHRIRHLRTTERIGAANTALVVTGGALGEDAGNEGADRRPVRGGPGPARLGHRLAGRDGSASGTAAVAVTRSDAALTGASARSTTSTRRPAGSPRCWRCSDLINGGRRASTASGRAPRR